MIGFSVERLRELFQSDPLTGALLWRTDLGKRAKKGSVAGSVTAHGYRCVGFDRFRNVLAHRVAWALHTGEWPQQEIDHIDGNRLNNAIANLRLVTPAENHQNMRRARSDSSTGVLGVSRYGNRYRAQIQVGGRKHWLGEHATLEQAREAYIEAKRQLHPKGTL